MGGWRRKGARTERQGKIMWRLKFFLESKGTFFDPIFPNTNELSVVCSFCSMPALVVGAGGGGWVW